MGFSYGLFIIIIVALFHVEQCHSDRHNHREEEKWISFVKEMGFLSETVTPKITSLDNKDWYFTETQPTDETSVPEVMHGNGGYDPTPRAYVIGFPIGGIILMFLFCYCCYKCCCGCCRRDVMVNNTTVVQQSVQHQQSQPPTQIVVQQFQPPAQVHMQQYPPAFQVPPTNQGMNQFQYQQPPINTQTQHAPPPSYFPNEQYNPGDMSASAPPQYGKY